MLSELKADIARYRVGGARGFTNMTFWVLAWYRLGHWMYRENCPRLLRSVLKIVYLPGYFIFENVLQMAFPPSAEIGPGLYMTHVGGIHISPEAIIGSNCDIAHHVTIGMSAMGRQGVPQIGNNVYVGANATLIGKIKIGDGAKIGANTLVISDIPAGATVLGVPGRVLMSMHPRSEDADAVAEYGSGASTSNRGSGGSQRSPGVAARC